RGRSIERRREPRSRRRHRHVARGVSVQHHVHTGLRRVLNDLQGPDPDRVRSGGDLAPVLDPHRDAQARAMTLYFAYGANMERAAMRKRCPGATGHGVATLRGWRYTIAQGYGCIARASGRCVSGVLWRLTPRDLAAL